MSRTPISEYLIHKPEEVTETSELFDAFVNLVPENNLDLFEDFREIRELMVSQLLENMRQKVEREGEVLLPFGLVVRRNS